MLDIDEVWQQYQVAPDAGLREQLILHYAPLVRYVAGRIGARLPDTVENADLVSYGLFGLIDAVEKFEPQRGLRFETYATSRIRGAILDELRSLDWLPRSIRSQSRQVEMAFAQLANTLQRNPTDVEIAEATGMKIEELRAILATVAVGHFITLDGGGADEQSLSDRVVDPRMPGPEELFESEENGHYLAQLIEPLTEREKIVVALYYYEGFTLLEIGRVLGVTESRVSQIHSKILLRLRTSALVDS